MVVWRGRVLHTYVATHKGEVDGDDKGRLRVFFEGRKGSDSGTQWRKSRLAGNEASRTSRQFFLERYGSHEQYYGCRHWREWSET